MLYLRAFHLIALVAWFAGLFYLPRLFVYHADTQDEPGCRRFCIMEYKLFFYIMNPAALLTIVLGFALLLTNLNQYWAAHWLHFKLFLVVLLILFHGYCGVLVHRFARQKNQHSARFYRFFNEIPTILLISIVILAIVKPF